MYGGSNWYGQGALELRADAVCAKETHVDPKSLLHLKCASACENGTRGQ